MSYRKFRKSSKKSSLVRQIFLAAICLSLIFSIVLSGNTYFYSANAENAKLISQQPGKIQSRSGNPVSDQVLGNSRGYLTTPQELAEIKAKANKGVEPYKSAYRHLIAYANRPWIWDPLEGRISCPSAKKPAFFKYAKALA